MYLITFSCYGSHLHGDKRGSVDPNHNLYRNPVLELDDDRRRRELSDLTHTPYRLEQRQRDVVLQSLQEVCLHNCWWLVAAHVRSTHVHIVVDAERSPEFVMNAVKTRASRLLNQSGLEPHVRKRWARHGSTRWLFKPESVNRAVKYVLDEQGERMSVYEEPPR